MSFVIRRRYVYVAAARPYKYTALHIWNAEVDSSFISIQKYFTDRSLPVAVLCRYICLQYQWTKVVSCFVMSSSGWCRECLRLNVRAYNILVGFEA